VLDLSVRGSSALVAAARAARRFIDLHAQLVLPIPFNPKGMLT